MRRVVALVGLGLLALPASAAAQQAEVLATSGNSFSPASLTVTAGTAVTFRNAGGFHNVRFEDNNFTMPASPDFAAWRVTRTFPNPGRFQYVCDQHAPGMSGVISVVTPGTPIPDTTPPRVGGLKLTKGKRRIGVRFDSGEAGTATITAERRVKGRYKSARRATRKVKAGRTRLTLRSLKTGRYRVTVRVKDRAGNISPKRRARIAI